MSSGYVFVVNKDKNYLGMATIAIESVLLFGKYPVEIFGIGFDYKSNISSNLMVNRIEINDPESRREIILCKERAIMQSQFEVGVYLDVDTISTRGITKIFDYQDRIGNIPLCPIHCESSTVISNLKARKVMQKMEIQESQPYVHADVILFNKECKEFFNDVIEMSKFVVKNRIGTFGVDECLVNLNLWKRKARDKYLEYIDPNYVEFENKMHLSEGEHEDHKDHKYYVCHGCKDIDRIHKIFNEIKRRDGIV